MTTVPRVRVALARSPLLALLLAVAHIGALTVISILTLPVWVKLLGVLLMVMSGAWSIHHAALLRAVHSIVELEVGEGGHASYREHEGVWRDAKVLESSFVSPWLTVLNLQAADSMRVRHVVILPDRVDAEAFRRLRVLLRWAPPRPGTPADPFNNRG